MKKAGIIFIGFGGYNVSVNCFNVFKKIIENRDFYERNDIKYLNIDSVYCEFHYDDMYIFIDLLTDNNDYRNVMLKGYSQININMLNAMLLYLDKNEIGSYIYEHSTLYRAVL